MSTPLASFFTKIGFEVDKSSLNSLDKQLGVLEKRIASMAKSFQGVTSNPAIRAAASLARAEAQKIVAETKLLKERSDLAVIEARNIAAAAKVSVANAAVQKVVAQAGLEKERQGTIYSRVNAFEMLNKMKVGSAADMAAIRESFDSGQRLRKKQEDDERLGRNLILMRKRNEVDESKARRELIRNQSYNNKVQLKGIVDVQRLQAQTAKFAQQAVTKATPYAQRTRTGISESSPSGGVSDPLFTVGNLKTAAAFEGLRRFGVQSYNLGNIQMGQQPQFEYITGSAEEATKQIDFLNKEVDRLGLNLLNANVQYRQLFAAAGKTLGTKDTQTLFTNFQNMATMLGLSTDAQNRGIRAFQQMISKGQVMA